MNSLCAFSTHAKEKTKNKTFFFFFFWEIILLLQKIFFLFYFFFSFSSLFFSIFLSVTLAACEVEKSVVIISEKERESAVTRCLTGMSRLARQDERRARVTRNTSAGRLNVSCFEKKPFKSLCWASKRQLLREEREKRERERERIEESESASAPVLFFESKEHARRGIATNTS